MPRVPPPKEYRFKPGQSGNPKGRALDPIANALKKLTLQQYRRIIKAVVKGNVARLQVIVEDNNSSALEVAVAACFMKAVQNGDYETVEKMLQRIVGKIPDVVKVESTNLNKNVDLNSVESAQTIKDILKDIEEEI